MKCPWCQSKNVQLVMPGKVLQSIAISDLHRCYRCNKKFLVPIKRSILDTEVFDVRR